MSLDIFWLRDDSLEAPANLPEPDVLAAEIVENLESAWTSSAASNRSWKRNSRDGPRLSTWGADGYDVSNHVQRQRLQQLLFPEGMVW